MSVTLDANLRTSHNQRGTQTTVALCATYAFVVHDVRGRAGTPALPQERDAKRSTTAGLVLHQPRMECGWQPIPTGQVPLSSGWAVSLGWVRRWPSCMRSPAGTKLCPGSSSSPRRDGVGAMFGDSYHGFTRWAAIASGHRALPGDRARGDRVACELHEPRDLVPGEGCVPGPRLAVGARREAGTLARRVERLPFVSRRPERWHNPSFAAETNPTSRCSSLGASSARRLR
jgi:hypothetical protein